MARAHQTEVDLALLIAEAGFQSSVVFFDSKILFRPVWLGFCLPLTLV